MTNQPKQVTVFRLNPQVFAEFEKQFRPLVVNEHTTPIQVARQGGIDHVLNMLRKGIVVENTNAPT